MTTTSPASTAVANPSRQRDAIDNLLRRELKVGDPRDPAQVAKALADRYQGDVRAQAIEGEAKGLPFLRTPTLRTESLAPPPTATNVDLEQAKHDVDIDLRMLLSDNLTKDIRPELEGWQAVIQRSIDEGVAAARLGLDPHKRDVAFAVRRHLGEYARLARLIGALTPALNRAFRNLAQSIDEACSVMLVLMGESMANLGFAGGRYLLQAPYSELQARRDAVLNALRNVDGIAATAFQGGGWPRGLRAYRQLTTLLEARGQGDLRSLMNEAELARTMDELIQLAGGNGTQGLRAIGATAWAPLARMHRFVQTTIGQVAPTSPELATLHEALQLFIDSFVPAGGFRLLRIARPAVLNYGLYGPSRIAPAEQRLIELVNRRSALARELDCLTDCACDRDTTLAQVVLDKILHDIDRAIDYYCVGDADLGLPEVRAAAYSHLIDAVIDPDPAVPLWPWNRTLATTPPVTVTIAAPGFFGQIPAVVSDELDAIRQLLRPIGDVTVSSGGVPTLLPPRNWATHEATYRANLAANHGWLGGMTRALRFGQVLHDELCLQRSADQQWRALIEQMTTGCIRVDDVFRDAVDANAGVLPLVVDRALAIVADATASATDPETAESIAVAADCAPDEAVVPEHLERSLEDIVKRLA